MSAASTSNSSPPAPGWDAIESTTSAASASTTSTSSASAASSAYPYAYPPPPLQSHLQTHHHHVSPHTGLPPLHRMHTRDQTQCEAGGSSSDRLPPMDWRPSSQPHHQLPLPPLQHHGPHGGQHEPGETHHHHQAQQQQHQLQPLHQSQQHHLQPYGLHTDSSASGITEAEESSTFHYAGLYSAGLGSLDAPPPTAAPPSPSDNLVIASSVESSPTSALTGGDVARMRGAVAMPDAGTGLVSDVTGAAGVNVAHAQSHGGGGAGLRLKPHSTPATLCWLERNYELAEGVCIPRNVVYFNYVDFCSKNQMQPVNAASFGKIIRQLFSNLTTRRLGTRGQSRYHYYGLAVVPDSIYYSPNYASRKLDHASDYKCQAGKQMGGIRKATDFYDNSSFAAAAASTVGVASGSASSIGTPAASSGRPSSPSSIAAAAASSSTATAVFAATQQLPEFPSFRDFDRASAIPSDKLHTLLTMYRAHCQRIMDSVNKFSFSEIPHLFSHFWSEMPPHIAGLLGQNVVVTLIGICDAILYRTILKAILPTATQMFPENVLKIVRKFADDVVGSLQYALKDVPNNLIYVKMKLVRQMSKMLKRRTSVNHLFQAACLVINPNNSDVYDHMIMDWHKIDLKKLIEESGSKVCSQEEIGTIADRFQYLLDHRSSMAQFCLWTSGLVDKYTKVNAESVGLTSRIRRFLVIWSSLSTKLLRQLKQLKPTSAGSTSSTSTSSSSASSFHILQLLLHEYILHEIEHLVCEDSFRELMFNMVNAQAPELSDSSFIDSFGQDFLSNPNLFHGHYEHTGEAAAVVATDAATSVSSATKEYTPPPKKSIKFEKGYTPSEKNPMFWSSADAGHGVPPHLLQHPTTDSLTPMSAAAVPVPVVTSTTVSLADIAYNADAMLSSYAAVSVAPATAGKTTGPQND